ncbi:MAG: hypothetical protein AB1749_07060 [Pseudomonadota bacterium]
MTVRARITRSLAASLALGVLSSSSFAADPKVPPGADPGGIAVAMVGHGIDYTDPEIAARLARDGEGELIGWDFDENDRFPWAPAARNSADPSGTELARRVIKTYKHARLVPIRISDMHPANLAKVAALLMRTPARIVAMPAWGIDRAQWEPFRQAASLAGGLLLVVAAGDRSALAARAPLWPAAFRLDNVAAVAPATAFPNVAGPAAGEIAAAAVDGWVSAPGETMFPMLGARSEINAAEAVALAAGLAACAQHTKPAADGKAAKAALLALARPAAGNPGLPVLDPMCWYGGMRN